MLDSLRRLLTRRSPAPRRFAAGASHSVRRLHFEPLEDRRLLSVGATEFDKLVASDAAEFDRFGEAVAVDGNTVLVGSRKDAFFGGSGIGAAYVHERDPATNGWSEQAVLAGNAAGGDQFGDAVALDENTAVVSAFGEDGFRGAAYVFERSGTAWTQVARLTAADGFSGHQFGNSLGIDGDTIVIGATGDRDEGFGSGAAYVFMRDSFSGKWSQQVKLVGSDTGPREGFGSSVSIDGETIVVGARGRFSGSPIGAAYVFVRDPSDNSWSEQAKLTASDAAAGDFFGFSIDVSGDTVVVGSPNDDDAGLSSGSAYVFSRNPIGGTWSQQAKLTASDASGGNISSLEGDSFGVSVAIDGNVVLVGAKRNDDACPSDPLCDSGSAYLFSRTPADTWIERARLTASDATAGDFFGHSVALDGAVAVVSAQRDDLVGAGDAGSAYVFSLPTVQISALSGFVVELDLHHGIENCLVKKLDGALAKLKDDNPSNDPAAVNTLEAFVNEVTAQRGKKISEEDADALIADALSIIGILNNELLQAPV